jgi:rhodanese-related sulfurtransferase
MSGRLLLIALICVVSGLLINNLMSAARLTPVREKPSGISLSSSDTEDTEDLRSQAGPAGFAALRYPPKGGLQGNEVSEQSDLGDRRINGGEQSAGKVKQHDPTLVISVESLLKKQKAMEEVILVDVRDPSEFQKCRIPGSISVPLYAVRTKQFLRSTTLVLINEGFKRSRLEERCRQLRDSGFMVWILEGGLNAWREARAPLDGEKPTHDDLNKLSPHDFFEERDYEDWIAVDARIPKISEEHLPFSRILSLGSPDSAAGFVAPLLEYLKKEKKKSPLFFVVFNDDGRRYEMVEKVIRKAGIKNAFYLEDGLEGCKNLMAQQAALLPREDRSGKIINKCAGCP